MSKTSSSKYANADANASTGANYVGGSPRPSSPYSDSGPVDAGAAAFRAGDALDVSIPNTPGK